MASKQELPPIISHILEDNPLKQVQTNLKLQLYQTKTRLLDECKVKVHKLLTTYDLVQGLIYTQWKIILLRNGEQLSSVQVIQRSTMECRLALELVRFFNQAVVKNNGCLFTKRFENGAFCCAPKKLTAQRTAKFSRVKTKDKDNASLKGGRAGYKDYIAPVLYCGGAALVLYGVYRYLR